MRWYEAVEKALVIWLYYLGVQFPRGLESLSHEDSPFCRIFRRRGLLPCLRGTKRLRNKWRRDHQPIQNPFQSWEDLVSYLRVVNDALEDALIIFDDSEWESGSPKTHQQC